MGHSGKKFKGALLLVEIGQAVHDMGHRAWIRSEQRPEWHNVCQCCHESDTVELSVLPMRCKRKSVHMSRMYTLNVWCTNADPAVLQQYMSCLRTHSKRVFTAWLPRHTSG